MLIENTIHPFTVSVEELEAWSRRPHKHNFFELVYIEKGSGRQCINDHNIAYAADNIFLLPPFDCHSFQIHAPTRFVFIQFNALFFQKDTHQQMDYSNWFNNLHYIISTYNRQPGDIIHNASDKALLINLIKGIEHEYNNKQEQSDSIIRGNMFALLNILVRNFENTFRENNPVPDKAAGDMLQYIQYNLFDNDKLRVDALASEASEFNLSANYVSEYFKKKTGESLKEYILKSRVNVAYSRIQNSGKSMNEIAWELGFTDASHLSKMIKKYFPPSQQHVADNTASCITASL
ncbi:AraC family transcriptional regulator [Chitinophaga sancti]|nr:AraC family transcriptional regulator [Chitinophaga sancti]WQD61081.1 AraC family transcriptional regulator [Chitinophaga sancti]WQG86790.1 AraC family transcriptional regulator [Chitinophaga sancti]